MILYKCVGIGVRNRRTARTDRGNNTQTKVFIQKLRVRRFGATGSWWFRGQWLTDVPANARYGKCEAYRRGRIVVSTFVLVHGAWHGAWCWHKVVPRLESAGHTVVTLDLPAHGTDATPVKEVTMDDHVDRVGEVLEAQSEPAVLVGHSMGGAIITQTAEEYTDEIDTLVYLTGFLLGDGEALLDYAEADEESIVTQNLVVDEDEGVAMVADEALREAFYADCDDADVTLAKSLLRPEPLAGLVTPMQTTDRGFGSLPRVYIGCEQDNAITPARQGEMRDRLPCDDVRSIDSSHSPFLSAPDAVATHLDEIA